jgi:2-polyprenyl-3-methyl-5-hydroxy-6-metoxy-1,4-benzoquinol methylase
MPYRGFARILVMVTLDAFQKKYDVEQKELVIRDRRFDFFTPASLDPFIDSRNLFHDFPLWVKIWEASIVLADYLARLEVDPSKAFLEIGCGIGLVGIVASAFGHRVTMTEYNDDAISFARANARLNGLTKPIIKKMDWHEPEIRETFDFIVASEVYYHERDFDPLSKLFPQALKPDGEIILASGIRSTSFAFMRRMSDSYRVRALQKTLRGKDKRVPLMLCRMTPK